MRPFDQLQNGVWFMTDEKIYFVILGWIYTMGVNVDHCVESDHAPSIHKQW